MTREQIAMIERLEGGLVWEWHTNLEVDDILRYLMDEGICRAREDIRPGLLQLTQEGRILLDAHRDNCAQAKKEEADQNAQEALRLKERSEDIATEERRHQEQKSTQIKTTLLSSALSFVAGVLAEHHLQIAEFFRDLLFQG